MKRGFRRMGFLISALIQAEKKIIEHFKSSLLPSHGGLIQKLYSLCLLFFIIIFHHVSKFSDRTIFSSVETKGCSFLWKMKDIFLKPEKV